MPAPNVVVDSPLELIGNTPVLRLARLAPTGGAELWAKIEYANPGGSLKDRISLAMIEAAESSGRLRPRGVIVEPTSGNTGIGLALVAAVKRYRLILTMPDTMSQERRSLLEGYGAEVELTPDSNGMHAAIARAKEIADALPDSFMPQQFDNPANPAVHEGTTAREILAQMPRLDAFVAGVGTGGTITGVGHVLRRERPGCQIIAVEPARSAVLSGGKPGLHAIQGIGAGFVPSILDRSVYNRIETVDEEEAGALARQIARCEGLLVGISSGANCAAALRLCRELGPGKVVLTLLCDAGGRYLTTELFRGEGI